MDDAIAVPARRSESISGYMRVAGYLAERDSIRRLERRYPQENAGYPQNAGYPMEAPPRPE